MRKVHTRRSERIQHTLKTESVLGDTRYDGVIENFSREGFFQVIPCETVVKFHPGMVLNVNFYVPSGHRLHMDGEIRWLRIKTNDPLFLHHNMGLEIIHPPPEYTEFVQALYNESFYHSLVQRIGIENL